MHVRMTDTDALLQQEALGIVGINLIFAAFYLHHSVEAMIASFLDTLSTSRIAVDMLDIS